MQRAVGISVHTGWGACVVVGGSPRKPEIIGNKVIELLGDEERFCYHRAAKMKTALVQLPQRQDWRSTGSGCRARESMRHWQHHVTDRGS